MIAAAGPSPSPTAANRSTKSWPELLPERPAMLTVQGPQVRLCDGISRRAMLRIGGLATTGLLWSDWLRARAADSGKPRGNRPSAKACILIYNYGGPSHLDT